MTEPLFVCEMIWIGGVAGGVARQPRTTTRRARRDCCAASRWSSSQRSSRATTAGFWLFWRGRPIGVVLLRHSTLRSRTFWIASAIVVAAPIVWFAYNAVVFGDWLDFARGPYSAEAIEMRTATPGSGPPHPGLAQSLGLVAVLRQSARRWTQPPKRGATSLLSSSACSAPPGRGSSPVGAPFSGRCCYGCRFPSMHIRLHSARCRSFFPSGGRTPGTTRATEWRCFRPSRLDSASSRNSCSPWCANSSRNWTRYRRCGCSTRSLPSNAWAGASRASSHLRRRHQKYRVAPRLRSRDPAGVALAAGNTAGRRRSDGDLGLSEPGRVHRNSAAPDHQRKRQGVLLRGAGRARRRTRQSCSPSMATRSTRR